MFTVMFHIVICTGDVHTTKEQHVHFVTQCQALTRLTNYTHKKTFVTRNINNKNFMKSSTFQQYKPGISFARNAYPWNPTLWKITPRGI